MARNSSPAADALLDKPIEVLDHGFVRLVDYLGNDARIVQAARVSYGEGTKTVREDAALIDYLLRNRHTSPFEMVELTLHIKAPIFVARQAMRHRTACLAGDALLYFDEPAAVASGTRKSRRMSIEEFHRKWHEGAVQYLGPRRTPISGTVEPNREYSVSELARVTGRRAESIRKLTGSGLLAHRRELRSGPTSPEIFIRGSAWLQYQQRLTPVRRELRPRLRRMNLRMCNEASGEIGHTRIVDIWQTGVKKVFEVTLSNGYKLKMSKDHLCLTEAGWMRLEEATQLRLREDGGVTWNGSSPRFAVNGVPQYRNKEWLQSMRTRGLSVAEIAAKAGASYHTVRKYLKIHGLQYSAAERARLAGKSQRGQRRTITRPPLSHEAIESIRAARSGEKSNFWKGGVTSERANIGRWTREQATRVHNRWSYRCALCGGKGWLHSHHIDPIWNSPARARDLDNLMSLCRRCHQRLHSHHLELSLLEWHSSERPLDGFWPAHPSSSTPPKEKPLPPVRKLYRDFASVVRIEYVGEEMTYDLEVEGPYHNFIANGLIVHNSVNEVSARYSVMPDEFYLPGPEEVRAQGKRSRQVGEGPVEGEVAQRASESFSRALRASYETYQSLLEDGVAREMAREVLPVGLYTEFYWKQDLHNLFHFLRLRMDWHAQFEIRAYGDAIARCVKAVAPMAFEAFEEHILHSRSLSREELRLLRDAIDEGRLNEGLAASGMRGSRQREFLEKLGMQAGDKAAGDGD